MKPQANHAPSIDIEPFLARHLEPLLRSCGFDIRSTSECSDLIAMLSNFSKFICRTYSDEIAKQLTSPENKKTKDELISWTVSELCALQAVTFHKFERAITNSESLNPGLRAIDCRTAAVHSHRLSEIYQSAVSEWKLNHAVQPASAKHRDKRRNRNWAPYLVDILFRQ